MVNKSGSQPASQPASLNEPHAKKPKRISISLLLFLCESKPACNNFRCVMGGKNWLHSTETSAAADDVERKERQCQQCQLVIQKQFLLFFPFLPISDSQMSNGRLVICVHSKHSTALQILWYTAKKISVGNQTHTHSVHCAWVHRLITSLHHILRRAVEMLALTD